MTGIQEAAADVLFAHELHERYRETWDIQDLKQVVSIYRRAISRHPTAHCDGMHMPAPLPLLAKTSSSDSEEEPTAILGPQSDDELRSCRFHLAAALGDLLEHLPEDAALLDEQIQVCRAALRDLHPLHHLFSALHHLLGVALHKRYETNADVEVLQQAIEAQRASYHYYLPGPVAQGTVMAELSNSLTRSFQLSGSYSELDEAATIARQAVDIEAGPTSFLCFSRLAYVLVVSFMARGKLDELRSATLLADCAIEVCPPGHRDRHKALGVAAMARGVYYEHSSDLADIQRSIEYLTEAVQVLSSASSCSNLALALQRRFSRKGDIFDLEQSIHLSREVLERMPSNNRIRDHTTSNLSFSLRHLFLLQGEPAILEEAIRLQRQGVERCALGEPQRFVPLDNLAQLLLLRFRQSLAMEDLLEAVALWREAFVIQSVGRPHHGAALCQLAEGLITLFRETREVHHLNEAIALHHQLKQVGNPNDHRRSDFLCTAGRAYYIRFQCFGDNDDLENSINHHRDSLALRPVGHPQRHRSLHELASALRARYELVSKSIDTLDVEKATSLQEEALGLIAVTHPDCVLLQCGLARLLLAEGSPLFSVSKALETVVETLINEHSSPQARVNEAADVLETLDKCVAIHSNHLQSPLARQLLSAHILAIRLLPSIAHFGLDVRARLRLLYKAEQIAARAAKVALSLNECATAMEVLEEGRAVFWSQYLRLRTRFDDLPGELPRELSMLANQLESDNGEHGFMTSVAPSPTREKAASEEQATKRRLLNEKFGALVQKVRYLPGYERYLLPADFTTLSQAASGGIVITLIPGENKSYALTMQNGMAGTTVTSLSLSISTKRLLELSNLLQTTTVQPRQLLETRTRFVRKQCRNTLTGYRGVLCELWDLVILPIFQDLRLQKSSGGQRPRVWWCATGAFAFLPIHAAGTSPDPASCSSNYVVSSYTPTLGALLSARQRGRSVSLDSVKMLLAGVPHPYEGEHLQDVVNETRAIKATIPPHYLIALPAQIDCAIDPNASPTVHDVVSRLPEASFLHLACHGRQDPDNALDSGFAMRDKMMTVTQLMALKLPRAFLAFLSACDTARGDERQPDQAMHLAATMLFVGFSSVVGTMWSIGDVDGPLVAQTVYENLFRGDGEVIEPEVVPYALDDAIQKLRKQGLHPSRWAPYIHLGV